MELKQLFIMIKRRLIFIIILPIILFIITFFISKELFSPTYEATSTLYVVKEKKDSTDVVTYEDILVNQNLVKDYQELVKSRLITKTALDELEIDNITPSQLSSLIQVSSKNDTRILELKVKHSNPRIAKDLNNKICDVFIIKSIEIMNLSNVRIIDTADLPSIPVGPHHLRNAFLALMVGFLGITGIFYLLEIISETIKTSEDIETYLELNVLGTIPSFQIN